MPPAVKYANFLILCSLSIARVLSYEVDRPSATGTKRPFEVRNTRVHTDTDRELGVNGCRSSCGARTLAGLLDVCSN